MVAGDLYETKRVLQFAKDHNYLLAIDEQAIWFVIKQTQMGMALDADYRLISLLIQFELIYKIQVNDANRNALKDPYKGEKFSNFIKKINANNDHDEN